MKKLQMAVVAVTVVQPPLFRTGTSLLSSRSRTDLVLATLVRDCGGVLASATVDDMIKAVGDEVIFSEISSYLCSS